MISISTFKSFLIDKKLTLISSICKTLKIVKITRLLLTLQLKLMISQIKD